MTEERSSNVKSITRATEILKVFTLERPKWGVSEIARELGLHKATTHRIIQTLEHAGLLAQDKETRKYRLGALFLERASLAARQYDIVAKARPYLRDLVRETQETCLLSVFENFRAVYVDVVASARSVKMTADLGTRVQLHCTASGKVLLAHLPQEAIDEFLRTHPLEGYTDNTVTDPAELKRQLAQIRAQGYAVDWEEMEEGLRCIASPIFDGRGRTVSAVSIAGPASRLTDEVIDRNLNSLLRATHGICSELGYKSSGDANRNSRSSTLR